MQIFYNKYLKNLPLQIIVDVGSRDVGNGSYYPMFKDHVYMGLDIEYGKNVYILVENMYNWNIINDDSIHCVISGQCLEHVEYPWKTMQEIQRILVPGGLCCIIVPSNGSEHRYPLDCYRYYPDGMRALAKYVGLETLECYLSEPELSIYDNLKFWWNHHHQFDTTWVNCVFIGRKPSEYLC
jgi:SAM-dependent methyltransferase